MGMEVSRRASNIPVTVGRGPLSIAVGDLSGDGTADLAVANVTDSTVSILLGNGNGTFTQATNSPISVAGASPTSVAMGDFNRDGILDVAVAIVGPNDVTILQGNGDGTFTKATGSPVAVGLGPYSVAVGDFNGDGIPDLVTANDASVNGNPGTATILLGRGDGSFAEASGSPIALGMNPLIVAVGDLNSDGKADLAVTNEVDNNVSVLLGNGDGTFTHAAASQTPAGFAPWSLALGDFNGDGDADLAVGNSDLIVGNSVTVYITQITESVTVTASSVSLAGAGTHLVEAEYPGDSIYLGERFRPGGVVDGAVDAHGDGDPILTKHYNGAIVVGDSRGQRRKRQSHGYWVRDAGQRRIRFVCNSSCEWQCNHQYPRRLTGSWSRHADRQLHSRRCQFSDL